MFFLNLYGITDEQFKQKVDSYRDPILWEQQNGEWKLKHQVS